MNKDFGNGTVGGGALKSEERFLCQLKGGE